MTTTNVSAESATEAPFGTSQVEGTPPAPAPADVPIHQWDLEEYLAGGNDSASAAKLADSGVAPLVVAARGFETIHEETLADVYKRFPLPRKNTSMGKRITEAISRGDVLLMPSFTLEAVSVAHRSAREPKPDAIQWRPAKPERDSDGREQPYAYACGPSNTLGVHPGIPPTDIEHAPAVLVAQGLLAGDAALTAYLLANGATVEDLSFDCEGGAEAARTKMRALMDRIDPDDRVLILTTPKMSDWNDNPDWRFVDFTGRDVWLNPAADVTTNMQAYRALGDLWGYIKDKRTGRPSLLAPTINAPDGVKKIGIDDYLSEHGTWHTLLEMLAPTLPARPPSNDAENAGKHRISEDGTTLEFCEPIKDDAFDPESVTGGKWVPVHGMGGRIQSIVASRIPTTEEIRTGVLGAGANNDAADWQCEVEIVWKEEDEGETTTRRGTISGPADILNYTPDQWIRHGANIPAPILRSEHWPPPRKIAEDWMKAVKAHKPDETAVRTRWDAMGWVPVEGSVPAFVVGDQVIGEDDHPDTDIFAGIGEAELGGATRFGVGPLDPRRLDNPEYAAEVRSDIEKMIETFVLAGAYTDRRVASVIVAAGLRPALPIRPQAVLYLMGPPRKGKSAGSAHVMGFWSRNPGDFTNSSLPGSAKDTAASMELAIARAPIWVVDDLAPSASRQESEREQQKVGDVARNAFNGAAKRRSDANMGTRRIHLPRALLVVTAENELAVASARDRCVTLNIGYGALNPSSDPTNAIEHMCVRLGTPARVTQALIKYIRAEAGTPQGWAAVYERIEKDLARMHASASAHLKWTGAKPGDLKRAAGLAADFAISLFWLADLAMKVGVRRDILDLLSTREMITDVFDLVADGHATNNESTPGRALIEAVAGVLARKKAHILSAASPAAAPTSDQGLAARLGWEFASDGTARPKGDTIGWYVENSQGERVIYFDQEAAFSLAQREYPNLILPGQGSRTSWGSVAGEGLLVNSLRRTKDGALLNTGQAKSSEGKKLKPSTNGSPVALDLVLAKGDLAALGQTP